MLNILALLGIGAALSYGAYTDYKERIIPNMVPLLILVFGCFTIQSWPVKLLSLVYIVLILVIVGKIMKAKSGGGDIKTYCALSFALGLPCLTLLLVGVIVIKKISDLINKKKAERGGRIPLCTYLALSYVGIVVIPALIGGVYEYLA